MEDGAPDAGRSLHDIDLRDGLLYASYWNDGLVILDVGNGMKGGSPSNPKLVTQYKYDLNDRIVRSSSRAAGLHSRHAHGVASQELRLHRRRSVPGEWCEGRKGRGSRTRVRAPAGARCDEHREAAAVAFYEPEYGGVHNVWVAGDTLYMGAYNAGFRAFDISGELRGDLRAQEREMHVHTGDMDGHVQNSPDTGASS